MLCYGGLDIASENTRLTRPVATHETLDINVTLGFILVAMNAQPTLAMNTRENLGVIDSLLHPMASPIRQLLTRAGRQELDQMLIDDDANILQALAAGVEIHSVYYSGEMLSQDLLQ